MEGGNRLFETASVRQRNASNSHMTSILQIEISILNQRWNGERRFNRNVISSSSECYWCFRWSKQSTYLYLYVYIYILQVECFQRNCISRVNKLLPSLLVTAQKENIQSLLQEKCLSLEKQPGPWHLNRYTFQAINSITGYESVPLKKVDYISSNLFQRAKRSAIDQTVTCWDVNVHIPRISMILISHTFSFYRDSLSLSLSFVWSFYLSGAFLFLPAIFGNLQRFVYRSGRSTS